MAHRVFGIVGWKSSGKTTLAERLVVELTRRGWRISTVKHAHHEFEVDKEGTDSFRHRIAGASEVAIVSSRRWALMHELRDEPEPGLEEVLTRMSPCDLVLVEGFKRGAHRKIEARRSEALEQAPLAPGDPFIVAIAADHETDSGPLPFFALDDIAAMADFVERETGLVS